ncbi:hypothetical protein [Streptomyces scabiei]|uniref:hypothetical protein n=1 Tax=Streptomyces scabiei TaxID=1930 RepID=UPI0029AB4904|nr:hypothetical protein [Streptomyces scabiei]MDX3199967.1 hypothetical protein [Streptomyces scabiei]MDX3217761.1 hypothetical protein [Streptomyces scabiei]
MTHPSTMELARVAYAAYGESTGHRNYQDLPMPDWDELNDRTQQAWVAAAGAVAQAVIEQPAETAVRAEQPAPRPSIGRIVHYKISEAAAGQINRARKNFHEHARTSHEDSGLMGHQGNWVAEGDVFPAVVVQVFNEATVTANLQVLLDGNDTYWATSAAQGSEPGRWSWPERV